MFKNTHWFTLGRSGAGDAGIKKFKEELYPDEKVKQFYVITGKEK